MKQSSEVVGDARDAEAIQLLKSDPNAYFEKTRRQPFGFGLNNLAKSQDRTRSIPD